MFKYIAAILLALSVACGGYAYYEHGEVVKLTQEVSTYKTAAEANLRAKQDADASCLITVDSLNKHFIEQKALESAQQTTGDSINNLPTLTIKEKANAAPTASQTPSTGSRYSDDDHLSPATMRLLDQAYCYGDKDGCTSPAK